MHVWPGETPELKFGSLLAKDGFQFTILRDFDSSVMRAYGLHFEVPDAVSDIYRRNFVLDLVADNDAGRYVLPVPATYVMHPAPAKSSQIGLNQNRPG